MYNAHIHYREVGPNFQTDAGFIQRCDVRNLHTRQGVRFWFEDKPLISFEPNIFVERIEDRNGVRLDRRIGHGWEFEFRRQTTVEFGTRGGKDFLRVEDLDSIVSPVTPVMFTQGIDFDIRDYFVEFETRPNSAINIETRYSFGENINFVPAVGQIPSAIDTTRGTLEATIRPTTPTRFTLSYLTTDLDDQSSGDFVLEDRITRLRIDWQLNTRWSLRFIGQHESTDVNPTLTRLQQRRRLNGDLLATYLVNPWTALFIGYNTNYLNRELLLDPMGNQLVLTGSDLNRDSQQLFVKFSYLLQR